ncbi:MAG: translation initiation factor Sui1 [bacterium]|nr:translation initiation factor Sui1 [bacterium]
MLYNTHMNDSNTRLVYSTEHGGDCPACGKPLARCQCKTGGAKSKKTQTAAPRADGVVRVGRETKGRKGKGVTVVTGVPLTMDGLRDLSRQLKQKCGSGGTVKEGVIEIQGDHRDAVIAELTRLGYTAKRSGG